MERIESRGGIRCPYIACGHVSRNCARHPEAAAFTVVPLSTLLINLAVAGFQNRQEPSGCFPNVHVISRKCHTLLETSTH